MADIQASPKTIYRLSGVSPSLKVCALALLNARNGSLTMCLPDGRRLVFDHGTPGPDAEIIVHDFNFAKRGMASGDIGFAEGYMAGEWDTPDLTRVLEFFAVNMGQSGQYGRGRNLLLRLFNSFRSVLFSQNTRKGAKKNILAHYDLGNDFYSRWLDPSMTYSSALFELPDMPFEAAQEAKYRRIAESINARPDSHILEIGSGWGGFAELAASQYGAQVTTVTISNAQHDFAAKRIFESGLNERVQVKLCDYRDIEGKYDGVASIEMFEAVGEKYWPSYFDKIHEVLPEGGAAALQIITIDDDLFDNYRKRVDFIQKYVFPGGMLPSRSALDAQFFSAGLSFRDANMFGLSYAETLKRWRERFNEAWTSIEELGFDAPFKRMWNFYLSYCEAGFRTQRIDVGQFTVSR